MLSRICVAAGVLILATTTHAAMVAYDASSDTLPADPPFTRYDADHPIGQLVLGYNAPQSVSGGIYQMGPTVTGDYTFWYTNNLTLDHTQTVEIAARLKLIAQTSANPNDRAGLGIAMTDDRNYYNELYLNEGEIFLNMPGTGTRVRGVAYSMDTTDAFHDYLLRLSGDEITVYVDGVKRLSGTIFSLAGLGALPTAPNWASIGDITSSAEGTWQMQSFSVSVVPEPSACAALIAIALLARAHRRRETRIQLSPTA